MGRPTRSPAPRPRPRALPVHRPARFEILQHRGLCSQLFPRRQFAARWNRQVHTQLVRDPSLLHDVRITAQTPGSRTICTSVARVRALTDQGSVAQNLYPNLVPDTSRDRAPQTGGDERLGNAAAAIGARSVRFAREMRLPSSVESRRVRNLGRKITMDPTTRCASMAEEITPPDRRAPGAILPIRRRNPGSTTGIPFCVLTTVVSGPAPASSAEQVAAGRAPSLQERPRPPVPLLEGTGDGGRPRKSPRDFSLHAVLLHGAKMRPARESVTSNRLRHARADVSSDGAAPAIRNLIVDYPCWSSVSAAATARRRIFPVAWWNTLYEINLLRTFIFCQQVAAVLDKCGSVCHGFMQDHGGSHFFTRWDAHSQT